MAPRTAAGGRGQARTRLARAAVVETAGRLFVERGYGATTIETISEHADVPLATVYRLFGSKHGILTSLLDVSIAGDHDDGAVADRAPVRALLAERDPRVQLAGFAAFVVQVNQRIAPVYGILVGAAAIDADAATLLQSLTEQRQEGQQIIARALRRAGALRPGIRERDAADIIHALLSPELYRLLVVDRGWKPDRYQQWLTQALVDQLLPAGSAGRLSR